MCAIYHRKETKNRHNRTEEIEAAKAKGMNQSSIYHFTVKEELHALLEKFVRQDEAILVISASKTSMFDLVKFFDQTYRVM